MIEYQSYSIWIEFSSVTNFSNFIFAIQEISHLHRAIRSAMSGFAAEARLLQKKGNPASKDLKALVERHRFLRAVCSYHQASEDEVLFPAVKHLLKQQQELLKGCSKCEEEHSSESGVFENLGRLLNEVRASAR